MRCPAILPPKPANTGRKCARACRTRSTRSAGEASGAQSKPLRLQRVDVPRRRSPSRRARRARPRRAPAAGRRTAPGVREKRGAGAGCVDAVDARRGCRARPCAGCAAASPKSSTGATQASVPANAAHHSSRVCVANDGGEARAQLRPAARSCCARQRSPRRARGAAAARRRTAARSRRPRRTCRRVVS